MPSPKQRRGLLRPPAGTKRLFEGAATAPGEKRRPHPSLGPKALLLWGTAGIKAAGKPWAWSQPQAPHPWLSAPWEVLRPVLSCCRVGEILPRSLPGSFLLCFFLTHVLRQALGTPD